MSRRATASRRTGRKPVRKAKLAFETMAEGFVRQREAEEWLKRNRAALDAYNEQAEKHGVFNEGLRSF